MTRCTLVSFLLVAAVSIGCGKSEPKSSAASTPPAKPEAVAPSPSPPAEPQPLSIPNGHDVEGALVGGQPTDAALEAAAREGYKTIINMRGEGEPGVAGEKEKVEALGMKYVSIPVAGGDSLSEKTARALDDALANAEGKVMVHCHSGNRVGAIYALREHYVRGKSPEEALAFGRAAGLRALEPAVRKVLGL